MSSKDVVAQVNWEQVRDETTEHLQRLIQFNTVNPPGNESQVAGYLKEVVEREGLEAEVLEAVDGRGNFVTRIPGTGDGKPILLMAHSDVVSVEEDQWTHPPFAGEIHDGMIWGRGAVDTKDLVATELMIMLLLKRLDVQLDRDVIMCTFVDEEAGSNLGARWMWENHRELIDAEFAINEGGGTPIEVGGTRFFTVQCGEKGSARMRVTASAEPGHASMPRDDTAMLRMGKALQSLSTHIFPTVMTSSVESMLKTFGDRLGGDQKALIDEILEDPRIENLNRLPLDDYTLLSLRAMTRNTAVPTIIHGGHRINVIPGEVTCDVDGRVLPGQDPEDFRDQVAQLLGPDVKVELIGNPSSGIEADPESPFFDTIRDVMEDLDSESTIAPFLVPGGTDARAVPDIKVYGFKPGYYSPPEINGAHNHDERLSIENLAFSTRALFEIVTRFTNARRS